MTYAVFWEAKATGLLSRFIDDSKGVAEVLDAGDELRLDPRPGTAIPYGNDDKRLHVGRYRIMDHITHVARV